MNDKYYKAYIEKLIEVDPVEINITQRLEIDDGYGGKKYIEKEISEIGTFYNKSAFVTKMVESGQVNSGRLAKTKLLTRANTDIKKGDKFTVGNRRYEVLYPQNYKNICTQIELDVITE